MTNQVGPLKRVRNITPLDLPGMQILRPCGCGVIPHTGDCWVFDTNSVRARLADWRDKLWGGRCQARLPRAVGRNPFEGRCELREHAEWFDHAVSRRSDQGALWFHRWTTEVTSQRVEGGP